MKHITEEYGQPCNKIESTHEEYLLLKNFLKAYGIESRMISGCGDKVEWQIRNGYKIWAELYRDNQITGQKIIDIVEDDIRSNCYQR